MSIARWCWTLCLSLLAMMGCDSITSKKLNMSVLHETLVGLQNHLSSGSIDPLAIERMAREAGFSFTQGHGILKPGMKSIGGGFGYFEKTNFFYDGRAEKDGIPTYMSPSFPSGYRGGVTTYHIKDGVRQFDPASIESPVLWGGWIFVISPHGFALLDVDSRIFNWQTTDHWSMGHTQRTFFLVEVTTRQQTVH